MVTKKGKTLGKVLTFKGVELSLGWGDYPENRVLNHDDNSKFVLVSFGELRFPDSTLSTTIEYIKRFLKAGLTLDGTLFMRCRTFNLQYYIFDPGVHYRFYGHSNSQFRSRSCFLREGTDKELDERIYALGDFKRIMNVAKRLSSSLIPF